MSIRKYIAYLRTVETGSITQAANELGYTQSAVSKMISDLEQDWQGKLLTRNLSSDGMVLLPTIREIVKDYEDLNFAVSELHGVQSGTLRLGCFTSLAISLLPEILKDFHQTYPNIQIQLMTGEYYEISEWLRRGAIDCGFLAIPASNDFETTPILHDTMVAILPKDHPMADASVFPLEQLPHENFVRLMEIEDYEAFGYLAPYLDGLDISLIELNDLAALLSPLDEVQEAAFEGLFSMEVQRKVNANGGVITLQDLRDLAVSAKTDCYHVVDAADDAQLGRFYAENDFVPELEGISDAVFEMLDFAGIGRMMRHSENGVFVNSLYVLQDGELTTAPPVQKALPEKPGYLFRLTLGLHPDIGDARTVTLDLPAAEAELLDAQEQLGVEGWEGVTVIDYDGIIPYAADFTDLPMELEEFNAFTKAARDIPRSEVPKLKALLKQFEVQDIETAMGLTEHLDDYVLTPEISSPQETAIDQLHFMTDDHSVELLISHVNLYAYGCDLIREDNAVLSPYGLLHRADYQPMLSPMQETQKMEMKMK